MNNCIRAVVLSLVICFCCFMSSCHSNSTQKKDTQISSKGHPVERYFENDEEHTDGDEMEVNGEEYVWYDGQWVPVVYSSELFPELYADGISNSDIPGYDEYYRARERERAGDDYGEAGQEFFDWFDHYPEEDELDEWLKDNYGPYSDDYYEEHGELP